jgi:hypothetical protein
MSGDKGVPTRGRAGQGLGNTSGCQRHIPREEGPSGSISQGKSIMTGSEAGRRLRTSRVG